MLSSHRIPVLTRAHSIVLPEHLPEISDIGEPRVIRDFRYRTVFFPEQLCRILQPHGADIVSRGMAGERLQLVEKSGAWYAYNGEKIGQGKANAMKWLNENPAKSDELEAKLRAELVANPEQALMADIEQSNDDAESDF